MSPNVPGTPRPPLSPRPTHLRTPAIRHHGSGKRSRAFLPALAAKRRRRFARPAGRNAMSAKRSKPRDVGQPESLARQGNISVDIPDMLHDGIPNFGISTFPSTTVVYLRASTRPMRKKHHAAGLEKRRSANLPPSVRRPRDTRFLGRWVMYHAEFPSMEADWRWIEGRYRGSGSDLHVASPWPHAGIRLADATTPSVAGN